MITPETALLLRTYTTMSNSVQGNLMKHKRGFEISGDVKRTGDNPREFWEASRNVLCVRNATFHADLTDVGITKEGPFVLQGESMKTDKKTLLMGKIMYNGSSTANTLVSFQDEDIITCSTTQEMPFGTVTTSDVLMPPWKYVRPVAEGHIPKIIAACAGGCFVMEGLNSLDNPSPSFAQALYENLSRVDIVAFTASAPAVLYRLASNAVLAAPDDFEEHLGEIQATLRVPPYSRSRERLPGSGEWQISGSLTDIGDDNHVTLQQVRDSDSSLRVYVQPFVHWQLPEKRIALRVRISCPDRPQDAPEDIEMRPWMSPGLHTGVETSIRTPAFATPRPGETKQSQRERLERIIRETAQNELSSMPISVGKATLDSVTQKIATAVGSALNSSALYPGPVSSQISAEFAVSKGDVVKLSSGNMAVVPDYALHSSSARMGCYIGGLLAAGLRVTFMPWSKSKEGFAVP